MAYLPTTDILMVRIHSYQNASRAKIYAYCIIVGIHILYILGTFILLQIIIIAGATMLYRCENCYRCYKYRSNLMQHRKRECGKEPRFICPIRGCNYRSKIKSNVKRHMRKHSREPTDSQNVYCSTTY